MTSRRALQYLRKNFDSVAIVTALATVAITEEISVLSEKEHAVLAALRRSNSSLQDVSYPEIQDYLRGLNETQIPGLVSNVKGILHEMEFVRLENEDGDSVYASFFDATNHPETDIQLIDQFTGEAWEVQLKATDDSHYASEWIDKHPDGEILVTEELAQKMDLPTSGQSNDELTANVEKFVDKMVALDDDDIWSFFPALTAASLGMVVWELWRRYRRGAITWGQFKNLTVRATGIKVAKIGLITALLTIPVVGQITGAMLVAKILISAKATFYDPKQGESQAGREALTQRPVFSEPAV
ncbi:MAG: hypothetical protein IH614_01075 [Desulfuromonadales bacterium]|nr:hypothetical protein [Desulfuromonadales bacterium]